MGDEIEKIHSVSMVFPQMKVPYGIKICGFFMGKDSVGTYSFLRHRKNLLRKRPGLLC